jgi:hypothetical protein
MFLLTGGSEEDIMVYFRKKCFLTFSGFSWEEFFRIFSKKVNLIFFHEQ